MKYTAIGFIGYTLVVIGLVEISTPTVPVMQQYNAVIAGFVPPDNDGPDSENGTGTRATEDNCKARGGGDRRECPSI